MKFQVSKKKGTQDVTLCELSLGLMGKTLELAVTREDYERLKTGLYDNRLVKRLLNHLPRKRSEKATAEQSTDILRRKKNHGPTAERGSRSSAERNTEDGP